MSNQNKVIPIQAFKDNYIWLIQGKNNEALVVDPGDARPVLAYIEQHQLDLTGILITHHHFDHTGGIQELLQAQMQKTSLRKSSIPGKPIIPVYGGYQEPITLLSHPLREGDIQHFDSMGLTLKILEIPGHTKGHIAFYSESFWGEPLLFCGDTLFTGGCGRVFEGTMEQMLSSLQKLKKCPPNTQVYCGHEYTLANLLFAREVEPNNDMITERLHWVQKLRKEGKPTVPSAVEVELNTNPFLRTDNVSLKEALENRFQKRLDKEVEIFREIRNWKDHFTI